MTNNPGDAATARQDRLTPQLARIVNGSSATGNSVRDAATAIIEEHVRRGRRGLAVCAPASGAGVSVVTAALGAAIAEAGVDVLVIDANLRQPSIDALITPTGAAEAGLLQFLTGEASDPATIVDGEVLPHLSVIYAGGIALRAQDLFDAGRFEILMRYALRAYELTLIDAPPANRCAETRRIAAIAGYAAVVARRDVTMSEDIAILVSDLQKNRTEVIGSIFNEG